ncbi:aminopeptidase P family protein [Candidatus Bipolaricaulota bacterium]|nr:aminopeptidase P family protein [Candidatus Bipolaricaulota bacterium]
MEYAGRLEVVSGWLEEHRLDLLLLMDRANTRYLTGFRLNRAASSCLVVRRKGPPVYVVAQLDLERARRDCWLEEVIPFPEDSPDHMAVLAPFLSGARRVGVERGLFSLELAERVSRLARGEVEFVDVGGCLLELRARKSPAELELLREAAAIADRVMAEVKKHVRPGVREQELVGLVDYLTRRFGAEGPSFEAFFMSGENAWLPQRVATEKALAEGELALLDMGAVYQGYCSDLTRTFAVGEPGKEQRELFQVAREAQAAALAAIRPGVRAREVDQAAREVIERAGWGEYFPHITGHGVGLAIHELPILDRSSDYELSPGMVVTVEPGIYLPGVGAARVEDMVVVTEDGCQVLTSAPRDLV